MLSRSLFRGEVVSVDSGQVRAKIALSGIVTPALSPLVSVPEVGDVGLIILTDSRSGFFVPVATIP